MLVDPTDGAFVKGVTKRAGRRKEAADATAPQGGGKPQVRKAVFESTKKREVGVSDLTLLSKISNEAINDNLKKRFENAEIYVGPKPRRFEVDCCLMLQIDLHWPCLGLRQPLSRS